MADDWVETSSTRRPSKRAYHFNEVRAVKIERSVRCIGLAAALRSPAAEDEWKLGWAYAGVRKTGCGPLTPAEKTVPERAGDDSKVLTSADFEYKLMRVKDNPWGDSMILRRQIAPAE